MKPTIRETPRVERRGGPRKGAGRKAVYRGKTGKKYAMLFTPEGHRQLASLQARSGLSRNDVIEHLLRTHPRAPVPRGDDPYPGKVHTALAIELTPRALAILDQLQVKSGQGRGVIGEFLIRTYGRRELLPAHPSADTHTRP